MSQKKTLVDVKKAWIKLPEAMKKRFWQRIYAVNPKLFKTWIKNADIDGFRTKTIANRKDKSNNNKLDKILFTLGGGYFAIDCITCYFVKCDTEINPKHQYNQQRSRIYP